MVSSELIKLLSLILAAVIIGGGGQILINKKRKTKQLAQEGYSDSSQDSSDSQNSSGNDDIAKNYITQYKADYPRESLKSGLLGQGITDSEAERYLNKYL